MAIAGMGCHFPGYPDFDSFLGAIRYGQQAAGRFARSAEVSRIAIYERAVFAATEEALAAALPGPRARIAVYAVSDSDASYCPARLRIMFDRFRDRFGGRNDLVLRCDSAESVFQSLQMASDDLKAGICDAALVVAGSILLADDASPIASRLTTDGFSLAISKSAPPPLGEGAAALVLMRFADVLAPRALLTAISETEAVGAGQLETVYRDALASVRLKPSQVGLLQLAGVKATTIAESTGLSRLYPDEPCETSLCGARAVVGDCGVAADLASLMLAAICTHTAWLPTVPGWTGPGPTTVRESRGLFVPGAAQMWFRTPGLERRNAAVILKGKSNKLAVALLQEAPNQAAARETAFTAGAPLMFPVAASDSLTANQGLDRIERAIDSGRKPAEIAASLMRAAMESPKAPLGLALVAANEKELRREIGFLKRSLERGFATGKAIRTPNGSTFAPAPLGAGAKIAFVYPGNGSAYVGVGRDLFLSLSGPIAEAERDLQWQLPKLLCSDLSFPRSIERLDERQIAELERALSSEPARLPLIGVAFGIAYTRMLRELLGIEPSIAFGYSIGEVAMRVALNQWPDWNELLPRLHSSSLLSGLTGQMTTVRRFFEEKGVPLPDSQRPAWQAHVIKAPVAQVEDAIAKAPNQVFITAINAPDEVIIGGLPDACLLVVRACGGLSIRLGFEIAIHSPPATLEHDSLRALGDNRVQTIPAIDFYSAYGLKPVMQTREATAESIVRMLQARLDFASLVDSVYAGGARVFIETGVRNNCTNWISATLGDRPHLAVAMDVKGVASDVSWARACAQLFAHRIPIDFQRLIDGPAPASSIAVKALESAAS